MQEEINKANDVMRKGGIILYPTDTIWGIGCDANNPEAVKKIIDLKGRHEDKAFICLINDIGQLYDCVQEIPEVAWDLVEFADKPLTVVYPKGKRVAPQVVAKDGSIAVRLVKDTFCERLIGKMNSVLVSTSANISGQPSAQTFSEIDKRILNGVDYVVNWRQSEAKKSTPSTIIQLGLNGEYKKLR